MWDLILMVVILCVMIAAVLVCVLFYFTPYQFRYASRKWDLALKPSYAAQQRDLFVSFTKLLHAAHVSYWITRDTLASVSTSSLLFTNDVITIAISHENERELLQLVPNTSFVIQQTISGYTCHKSDIGDFPRIIIDVTVRCIHEILPCTTRNALGECLHCDSYKRRNEIYLASHVFPLQDIIVEGVTVSVPQKYNECAIQYMSPSSNSKSKVLKWLVNDRTKAVFKNILTVGRIIDP